MKPNRIKIIGLLLLIGIIAGLYSTSRAVVTSRRFIPITMSNAYSDPPPQQLRIDSITLANLDQALRDFGIGSAAVRQEVYNDEYARRNGNGGAAPEGYPAPESAPEGVVTGATGCGMGQGCVIWYKGAGAMRIRWLELSFGWTLWSNVVTCPPQQMCITIARIHSTSDRPLQWQRHWASYQIAAQFMTPIVIKVRCVMDI